mmetsp:Transcript_41883/g.98322  ORF Transcript_41883/g.98322 Transcript_41883/m.98322 type:complete len:229 (+) Transcript_41883:74-760(+)
MSSPASKKAKTEKPKNIHVSAHSLVSHKVTEMRKTGLSARDYRQLMKETTTLVMVEATHHLKHSNKIPINTDEEGQKQCRKGSSISERLAIVPLSRGGLGMTDAAMEMLPTTQVLHLGIEISPKHEPDEYYNRLPETVAVERVFILDPMLVSGRAAVRAIDILQVWGAGGKKPVQIELVALVATPEAIKLLSEKHPEIKVYVGMIDEDEEEPIMPSLGDVGHRLFNTC